jgi:hypothetical protein
MADEKGKWLFGTTNIRWGLKEIVKIYSNKDSFFSKKRIESGIAFVIAEWAMIFFLVKKFDKMDMMEFGGWATIQFAIAGYMVKQIQNEKVNETSTASIDDGVIKETNTTETIIEQSTEAKPVEQIPDSSGKPVM